MCSWPREPVLGRGLGARDRFCHIFSLFLSSSCIDQLTMLRCDPSSPALPNRLPTKPIGPWKERQLTEGVLADQASPQASGASIAEAPQPQGDDEWWRDAVIYQVYVRSFADANGDGIGDLAGVRSKLPYLRDLGVDAIWFAPWYLSPQADGGYDVADYRAIDPAFGTLAEAEELIAEARAYGIRTI